MATSKKAKKPVNVTEQAPAQPTAETSPAAAAPKKGKKAKR